MIREKSSAKVVEMANENSLPGVEEAIEISIKLQKEREINRNHPSWNIADEEKSVMELMNESADEIYENKSN